MLARPSDGRVEDLVTYLLHRVPGTWYSLHMTTTTNTTPNAAIIAACDDLRAGNITYAEWLDRLEAANVTIDRDEEN